MNRLKTRAPDCTGTTLKWSSGACGGGWQLAAGGIRNTKDRDAMALEVRAGTSGVELTSQYTAGLSSTNSNRVKVARRAQWTADCDLSVLR